MSIKEWGNITWRFFHTLAQHIDENKFAEVRSIAIEIVISTCKNLPCPDCTEHASHILLKKAYIKNIKTKHHFIEFLRQFHNIVNIKLYKKSVSKEELKDKYSDTNLNIVIRQFIKVFSIQTHNMRLMNENFQRNLYLQRLTQNLNKIKYALI